MRFYLKNNLTTKMKLYTTNKYMSTDTSFEKKKKILTTKMKLYTTSEFISNDISFEKKKQSHYKNETLHNW